MMDLNKGTIIIGASLVLLVIAGHSSHASDDPNPDNYSGASLSSSSIDLNVYRNEAEHKNSMTSKINNDTRLSTLPTSNVATITSSHDESRRQAFCIATPQPMSFCHTDLKWATVQKIPNLLGHWSEEEINADVSSYPLQELTSVECKASHQLKLLLCSVISPVCLDANLVPCRSLCLAVKSSCEAAMRNQGLEWPKFLDCRRLPRRNQVEICIERQPMVNIFHQSINSSSCASTKQELDLTNSNRATTKRKRKEKKKTRTKVVPSGTTKATTTTTPPPSVEDLENVVTKENSSNFTTQADTIGSMSTFAADTRSSSTTEITTTTKASPLRTTTSTELATAATSSVAPTTTMSPISSTGAKPQVNSELTTTPTLPQSGDNTNSFRQDYSSMPVNVTDDLTQLLCSTSPDWLIKTKLNDNQLITAVSMRKLKVRSYHQIFGSLANKDGAGAQPPGSRKSAPTNLYLNLTNTTVFVAPIGANLYTQPMSDALHRAESDSSQNATLKSIVRYYLIAGSGTNETTKSTSVFVVWPSGRTPLEPDFQGSVNIIKTYREFKRKGAEVCNQLNRSTLGHNQQVTNVTKRPTPMLGENSTLAASINKYTSESSSSMDSRQRRDKKRKSAKAHIFNQQKSSTPQSNP